MGILGWGHKGVVVADTPNSVKKFYKTKEEWEKENTRLKFLSEIQKQGFDIGCIIPKLLNSASGDEWEIDGKTYNYCNTMERIHGVQAKVNLTDENLKTVGTNLGTVLYVLHTKSKAYMPQWIDKFGEKDELLTEILEDKVPKVLKEGLDKTAKEYVKKAASYLEQQRTLLKSERTLSHLDLNLPNVLINKGGIVEGLVDWGDFGLTHPSLSLYQQATNPKLWAYIQAQYEKLGGKIREDIVYAASVTHLAWAPIICKEMGQALDEYETRERLKEVYSYFVARKV
jgi:hypothetical protein